jgi:multicomponent Na+:H+ antiporter subunit E
MNYFKRMGHGLDLALFFICELVLANLRVAYEILTPRHHMKPGIVGIPLDASTDLEITALANIITLTPGTLSLDISPDRRVLYIHAMYVDVHNLDQVRRAIKQGFERRLLRVLR